MADAILFNGKILKPELILSDKLIEQFLPRTGVSSFRRCNCDETKEINASTGAAEKDLLASL